MRKIDMIVVHCSGSRCDHRYTLEQLRHDHVVVNGWRDIGYHFYITLEGVVYPCRPVERMGAHALGYNAHSIGICYEGGLDPDGHPADTRTPRQRERLEELLTILRQLYPQALITGHNHLTPHAPKACPCFDAEWEYRWI